MQNLKNNFIGKLKSCVKSVPDLTIKEDEVIIIGRNPFCQIKELKCPQRLYEAKLKTESNNIFLYSNNLVTNFVKLIRPGEHLAGPGFNYKFLIELDSKNNFHSQSMDQSKSVTNYDNYSNDLNLNIPITWETHDCKSVYVGLFKEGGQASCKIIAFDFDGTLVKVKSKSKFPKNSSDWKLFDSAIPATIKKWADHDSGPYRFVIFTNQLGISQKNVSLKSVQDRIESALMSINVPCIVFIAANDNIYRKPRPGLLELFQSHYNQKLNVDLEHSFYVGDAAGRKTLLHRDHSCCDLLFAFNTGLKFLTPEQFLANQRPKTREEININFHHLPKFNPKTLCESSKSFASELDLNGSTVKQYKSISELIQKLDDLNGSLVIIFVGLPGSGKTNFFSNYLSNLGYIAISRDQLGTMDKCEKKFLSYVSESNKQSKLIKLVIDNINIDKISRSRWINLASSAQLKKICFFFNIDPNHAKHNNNFRKLINFEAGQKSNPAVPDWLISKSFKNLASVDYQEGFDIIFRINFQSNFLNRTEKEKKLYFMYLCDH